MQAKHHEQRASLRQHFRRKRSAISPSQHDKYASQIIHVCEQHQLFMTSRKTSPSQTKLVNKVALYLSFDGELDTQALIHYLWSQKIEVYLPVLHPFSKGHLLFLRYTSTSHMQKNQFGINEPILDLQHVCPLLQLDIIFTPLVAFDNQGNRLGMGGGFYDRTLAGVLNKRQDSTQQNKLEITLQHEQSKPRVIGLALDEQESRSLPTEVWDIPLPQILTPTTLHHFS